MKPIIAILALCLCSCATIHGPQRYTYSLKYQWMTEEIYQICVSESARNELPLSLVLAVIDAESSGRTNAVSKAGALGLMQVMPKYWYKHGPASDLHKPEIGIRVGCSVLRWARDLAKGDVVLTLRNYERGPRGRGINWKYTNKILRNMRSYYHERPDRFISALKHFGLIKPSKLDEARAWCLNTQNRATAYHVDVIRALQTLREKYEAAITEILEERE